MRAASRRFWLRIHLWLGLGLGGLFALLGLTGSVLVFYLEVDGLLNPRIQVTAPAAPPAPDAVLQRLQALHPERHGPWRIEMPLAPDRPVLARYYNPPETAGRGFAPLMLSLDPRTLEETSHRFWGEYFTTWLYDLHYTLLLGQTGRKFVGYAGLLLLVSMLTGLALWWPSRARLAAALRPVLRPGVVRKVYDLHVLPGVYGLAVLVTLALTGTVLALPEVAQPVVGWLSPVTLAFPARAGLLEEGSPRLSLAAAVAIGQSHFQGAELRWIETPGEAGQPISVRFHRAGEPGRRFARNQIWLDPGSGAVLAVRDLRLDSGGDAFLDWMHPLHNGEAFGLAGRILACVGGLLPMLLLVTGWLRWRHKRTARRGVRAAGRPGGEMRGFLCGGRRKS